jgi:hypothetical protein
VISPNFSNRLTCLIDAQAQSDGGFLLGQLVCFQALHHGQASAFRLVHGWFITGGVLSSVGHLSPLVHNAQGTFLLGANKQ